jgi:hypothetical protein
MIDFGLYKNSFANGKGFFRAIVFSRRTYGLGDVIDRMVEQGTTLTRQDIMATLDLFFETIFRLILEGNTVLTPLFNLGVSIKGNFESQTASFDPSRNRVAPRVNANAQFKNRLKMMARVQQHKANRPMPQPEEYLNPNNGAGNDVLTPGGGAKLRGHALKFNEADTEQGIFLVAEDQSRVRIDGVMHNTQRELIFLVPSDLASGEYTIEVRSRLGGENVRVGFLEQTVSVPGDGSGSLI